MLNTRLRKQIEWHFYNHKADLALYEDKARDIIESGLTVNFGRVGSGSSGGSQTESKVIRLEALDEQMSRKRDWSTVVRNVWIAFPPWSYEHKVMIKLYVEKKSWEEIFAEGTAKSTFLYWRDKWLLEALMWAQAFELL